MNVYSNIVKKITLYISYKSYIKTRDIVDILGQGKKVGNQELLHCKLAFFVPFFTNINLAENVAATTGCA